MVCNFRIHFVCVLRDIVRDWATEIICHIINYCCMMLIGLAMPLNTLKICFRRSLTRTIRRNSWRRNWAVSGERRNNRVIVNLLCKIKIQSATYHSEVLSTVSEFWDCWDRSLEDLLDDESIFFRTTQRCLLVLGPALRGEYCLSATAATWAKPGDGGLSFSWEWLRLLACRGLLFSFVSRNPLLSWRLREPLLSCWNRAT